MANVLTHNNVGYGLALDTHTKTFKVNTGDLRTGTTLQYNPATGQNWTAMRYPDAMFENVALTDTVLDPAVGGLELFRLINIPSGMLEFEGYLMFTTSGANILPRVGAVVSAEESFPVAQIFLQIPNNIATVGTYHKQIDQTHPFGFGYPQNWITPTGSGLTPNTVTYAAKIFGHVRTSNGNKPIGSNTRLNIFANAAAANTITFRSTSYMRYKMIRVG